MPIGPELNTPKVGGTKAPAPGIVTELAASAEEITTVILLIGTDAVIALLSLLEVASYSVASRLARF